MASLIRILPDLLINQIAAGEVIEDPASVVKELLDNSVDAGASSIEIELIAGGHRLIRVNDDGSGMSKDDAVLCFERHATSKVRTQEDLEKIFTMGFRGEALAAIASISKVTLRTSMSQGMGHLIEIHGGKLVKVEPCSRARGTTIEVRDLFYNTPARRKFQKSSNANSAKIERMLSQISLGHPHIEFTFTELEKKLFFSRQEKEGFLDKLKGRMGDVFSREFAEEQLRVEIRDGEFLLRGYISPPEQHRPQKNGQIVFVNGRLIQAPLIGFAIREAYGSRLPEGRHPLFVVHLTLPTHEVDVNVHPQKKEIRFKQEDFLRHFLRKGVLEALSQENKSQEPLAPVYFDFKETVPWTLMEPKSFPQEQPSLPLHRAPKTIALLSQYLLVDGSTIPYLVDGIVVVDLQKALERIMYDQFTSKKKFAEKGTQKLLVPLRIEMNKAEAEDLRGKMSELQRLGISITEMGEKSFCVEEIPQSWNSDEVVDAIFSFLAEEKQSVFPSAFRRCIKSKFLLQEAEEILHVLFESTTPQSTPLGHPTMVLLEESWLHRLFIQEAEEIKSRRRE